MVKKTQLQPKISQSRQNAIYASNLGYKVVGSTVYDPSGEPVKLYKSNGYPSFKIPKKLIGRKSAFVRVHQLVAWEKYGIEMLTAELIRHKDDNKDNFSWSNILLGTWEDNMNDFWLNLGVRIKKKIGSLA